MKQDSRVLIAFALSFVMLVLWRVFFVKEPPKPATPPAGQPAASAPASPGLATTSANPAAAAAALLSPPAKLVSQRMAPSTLPSWKLVPGAPSPGPAGAPRNERGAARGDGVRAGRPAQAPPAPTPAAGPCDDPHETSIKMTLGGDRDADVHLDLPPIERPAGEEPPLEDAAAVGPDF